MISPFTKPGTKVVVTRDTGPILPKLSKGMVVEVDRMVIADCKYSSSFGEIGVQIKGINHLLEYPNQQYRWWRGNDKTTRYHYSRENFDHIAEEEKREALPESVTRLLDTKLPEVVD